jgi:hypothetical protein
LPDITSALDARAARLIRPDRDPDWRAGAGYEGDSPVPRHLADKRRSVNSGLRSVGRLCYLNIGVYWGLNAIYLLLYASVWRGAGEITALLAAFVAPSRAALARRLADTVCLIAYYVGVPVLVALPFLV